MCVHIHVRVYVFVHRSVCMCVCICMSMCTCMYVYNYITILSTKTVSHDHIHCYRVIGHCRSCEELDNKARLRADYSTYRLMLKEIKQSEERYNDGSHIVFLMQVRTLTQHTHCTVTVCVITVGDGPVLSC